jgi:hypothetical protein
VSVAAILVWFLCVMAFSLASPVVVIISGVGHCAYSPTSRVLFSVCYPTIHNFWNHLDHPATNQRSHLAVARKPSVIQTDRAATLYQTDDRVETHPASAPLLGANSPSGSLSLTSEVIVACSHDILVAPLALKLLVTVPSRRCSAMSAGFFALSWRCMAPKPLL